MKDNKSILIILLLIVVGAMTIGYAALASTLNINGTAAITSRWDVKFTNITEGTPVGGATNKTAASYTATTATFDVELVAPGDKMTYDITVTNAGTLDAKLDSITGIPDDGTVIKYSVSGVNVDDVLTAGSTDTITVSVEYLDTITSQPSTEDLSNTLTVTLNYVQSI